MYRHDIVINEMLLLCKYFTCDIPKWLPQKYRKKVRDGTVLKRERTFASVRKMCLQMPWHLTMSGHKQAQSYVNVSLTICYSIYVFVGHIPYLKIAGRILQNHTPMMTSSNGNIFRVTGPLCGEFTGHRWIPRTKASDAEL